MAGYDIRITATAAKELAKLPRKKERQAVTQGIRGLATDPRPPGCAKLSGHSDLYRVRQGRYRILYEIQDAQLVVLVIRVADRKNVYRGISGRTGRTRKLDE